MVFYYLNEAEINNVHGAGWCNCRGESQSGYASPADCREYCCPAGNDNVSVSWTWKKHWWSRVVTKEYCGSISPLPKIIYALNIGEGRPSVTISRPNAGIDFDSCRRQSIP